jgi:septation ring formation regulator EzrA
LTSRDLQRLEELANRKRSSSDGPRQLEEEAIRLALRTVDQLGEGIELLETTLQSLGLLFEDFPLQKALVGAIGISVTEMRSQVPALREAAREAGK